MKISKVGLELIKAFEGWVPHVYPDEGGLPTVGFGHLITLEERTHNVFAKPLSLAEGEALLVQDVERFEAAINRLVTVPLSQAQFDALCSFTFNVGEDALTKSTLLRKLNGGDYAGAASQFLRWNKVTNPTTGQPEPSAGLTKRRQREADLFRLAPLDGGPPP